MMGIIELSDRFFGLSKNKLQKRLQSRFDKISFKARSLTPAALAAALSACNDNQGIVGSNGDDVLGNTVADEVFYGRLGNDIYSFLQSGKDTIYDSGGNDVLKVGMVTASGESVSTMFSRVGNNLLVTQDGNNSVTVEGAFATDGSGLEHITLTYADGSKSDEVLNLVGDDNVISNTQTNIFIGTETASSMGESRQGWIIGSDSDDVITLSSKSNVVETGSGNDKITFSGINNLVRSGDGDDVIYLGLGNNEAIGGSGNDILIGSSGNDKLIGGTGNDIITGGAGSDEFVFGINEGKDIIGVESSAPIHGIVTVTSYPHLTDAFTQGLLISDGKLYEGTGLRGSSSLREVNLETGDVIQQKNLNAQYFGEGVTVFGNKIYQLTWTSGNVFIYDKSNFELQQTLSISGEGWGLTNDREHLILSNGTSVLQFLDPETLNVVKTLTVNDAGISLNRLNELEYINGEIWANIWKEDYIVRIDADTGLVKSYVDLSSISERKGSEDVLNGIAYDANTGKIYVTGKNWSKIYEIEIDVSVDLSATGTKIYLNDFNASEDKLTAVGFNYANGEELISHVTETKTGGLLFSDQGTEVEIPDLDLQTALSQDIEIILMSSGTGSTEDLSVGQPGSGGCWCCTASFKQGEMQIKKVKAFRRWHVKKSRIWQEGYHIWGRIVADQWLSKSKWAAKGTNDLFNLIMNGKITFRGLLAWLVITPPALLIGSYVVLKKEIFKEVKEGLIQK